MVLSNVTLEATGREGLLHAPLPLVDTLLLLLQKADEETARHAALCVANLVMDPAGRAAFSADRNSIRVLMACFESALRRDAASSFSSSSSSSSPPNLASSRPMPTASSHVRYLAGALRYVAGDGDAASEVLAQDAQLFGRLEELLTRCGASDDATVARHCAVALRNCALAKAKAQGMSGRENATREELVGVTEDRFQASYTSSSRTRALVA